MGDERQSGGEHGQSWFDKLLGRSPKRVEDEPEEKIDDVPLVDEQGREVKGGLGSLPFTG